MGLIEAQEKFIHKLLESLNFAWDSIHIDYEYYPWKGEVYEKFISVYFFENNRYQFMPSLEAIDCLVELNACIPEGQTENWTWLDFIIEKTGKYKFNYKYGVPPLVAETLKYTSD